KWQDQSGQDRYSTEVVLRPYKGELTLLDGRNENEGNRDIEGAIKSHVEHMERSVMDDEIPF
ncbi:MAG: single-stranded DNA-binding protein, partial [Pseudomonadota bacterium]